MVLVYELTVGYSCYLIVDLTFASSTKFRFASHHISHHGVKSRHFVSSTTIIFSLCRSTNIRCSLSLSVSVHCPSPSHLRDDSNGDRVASLSHCEPQLRPHHTGHFQRDINLAVISRSDDISICRQRQCSRDVRSLHIKHRFISSFNRLCPSPFICRQEIALRFEHGPCRLTRRSHHKLPSPHRLLVHFDTESQIVPRLSFFDRFLEHFHSRNCRLLCLVLIPGHQRKPHKNQSLRNRKKTQKLEDPSKMLKFFENVEIL